MSKFKVGDVLVMVKPNYLSMKMKRLAREKTPLIVIKEGSTGAWFRYVLDGNIQTGFASDDRLRKISSLEDSEEI